MFNEKLLNKSVISRAVISFINEEEAPDVLHAKHIKDYESPRKVKLKGKDFGFTPDIAVYYKNVANFYEIELKKPKTSVKWRLFSLYARNNNGNLFIVVPDYLKDDIKKEVEDKDINADVLFFQTE
jgi:hypothetical protein